MRRRIKNLISDIIHWIVNNLMTQNMKNRLKKYLNIKVQKKIKTSMKQGKSHKKYKEIDLLLFKMKNLGFEQRAYQDLINIFTTTNDLSLKRKIGLELAVWHANLYTISDAKKSQDFLNSIKKGVVDSDSKRKIAIIESENLALLSNLTEAKKILNNMLRGSLHPDLLLAQANLEKNEKDKVNIINRCLKNYGLMKISLSNEREKTIYDRVKVKISKEKYISHSKKVTVIMPVYNAADVIRTSLESILNQTWRNLEVIMVDDCSKDNTVDIIKGYQKKDSRIKLLELSKNSGPYVARNEALKFASGDYVTINDADDWSHPQKIEKQALHLAKNAEVMGNTSQQARASDNLQFNRRGKPGIFIFSNMSSFMFKKDIVLEKLGNWDSVRFGADSEFIKRLKKVFGQTAHVELKTGPLSFQRYSTNSLTGNSAFGFPNYFMGARREYLEAQTLQHKSGQSLKYDYPMVKRPFEVPNAMQVDRKPVTHYDVIIASDFRLDGGSTKSSIEEIKAQKKFGFKTAIFQMNRYDYSPKKKINPEIRDMINKGDVNLLVYGEKATCDLLILRYPPILQENQKYIPSIKAEKIVVILNQTPMSDYSEEGIMRYNIKTCNENLKKYFGDSAVWYPIGPLIRKTLYQYHKEDLNNIQLSNEDWSNIIDINEWESYKKRNSSLTKIVIGRHSRAQSVKWPEDKKDLLKIYPESEDFEVRILGGAKVPIEIIGYKPENWIVYDFGEVNVKEFLKGVDVFVYFTHSKWVESFGRVIIEAMASGIPVILPYQYKPLFNDAAIYANPDEVQNKVLELMRDDEYYHAVTERAFNLIEAKFSYKTHQRRLDGDIL